MLFPTIMKSKKLTMDTNKVIAIDFGYSEVMTDSDGKRYGKNFGNILKKASDDLKVKMQSRHNYMQ